MTSEVPTGKPIHPAFPKPGPGPAPGLDDSLVVRREINIDDVVASPWIGLHYRHELLLHHRHEELEPPTVDEAVRALPEGWFRGHRKIISRYIGVADHYAKGPFRH